MRYAFDGVMLRASNSRIFFAFATGSSPACARVASSVVASATPMPSASAAVSTRRSLNPILFIVFPP